MSMPLTSQRHRAAMTARFPVPLATSRTFAPGRSGCRTMNSSATFSMLRAIFPKSPDSQVAFCFAFTAARFGTIVESSLRFRSWPEPGRSCPGIISRLFLRGSGTAIISAWPDSPGSLTFVIVSWFCIIAFWLLPQSNATVAQMGFTKSYRFPRGHWDQSLTLDNWSGKAGQMRMPWLYLQFSTITGES